MLDCPQMIASLKSYFNVGGDAWVIRRRLAIWTLIFCAALIIWGAGWMRESTANSVITQAFVLMTLILTTYVFGAIWDDHLKRQSDNEFIAKANSASASAPNIPPVGG